jgi:hypothetical protein
MYVAHGRKLPTIFRVWQMVEMVLAGKDHL